MVAADHEQQDQMTAPVPLCRCDHCGKTNGAAAAARNGDGNQPSVVVKLKLCTGCRRVFYCDAACQRSRRQDHRAICSPRVVRMVAEEAMAAKSGSFPSTGSDGNGGTGIDERSESRRLASLARVLIERKICPEGFHADLADDLVAWLREMLLGPALHFNKEVNFEEDILKDGDFCADAEIFVENLPGCPKGLVERNREDVMKAAKYPEPKSELRVREDLLGRRCEDMVVDFAKKKGVADAYLIRETATKFFSFYREIILQRPSYYNSYTGLTALMMDPYFLKSTEDVVLVGLGLQKEVKVANKYKQLEFAPPKAHSIALYLLVLVICMWNLPSLEKIDEYATVDAFTESVYSRGPLHLSPVVLSMIRLIFAAICVFITGAKLRSNVSFVTVYLAGSKLQAHRVELRGMKTQGFYTSWAWNLLGVAFFLGGLIPLLVASGREDVLKGNPWILRAALICFEIAAPSALLTSAVVTYALWPHAYKTHGAAGTVGFKSWVNFFQHNVNTVMVLTEVCFLGGLPVKLSHAAVALMLGLIYLPFAWSMTNRWSPKNGPVFLYFFLDTTLPGVITTFLMLALVAVLLLFYASFSLFGGALLAIREKDLGVSTTGFVAVLVSSLLMKFSD